MQSRAQMTADEHMCYISAYNNITQGLIKEIQELHSLLDVLARGVAGTPTEAPVYDNYRATIRELISKKFAMLQAIDDQRVNYIDLQS